MSTETEKEAGEAAGQTETAEAAKPDDPKTAATEPPGANGGEEVAETESSPARIGELEAQVAELDDRYKRALAEVANTQKRAERSRAEGVQSATRAFGGSLLRVFDAFDRLHGMMDEGFRAQSPQFVSGVELVQKQLVEVFATYQISIIEPNKGDEFNPHLHESMFKELDESVAAGTIVQVLAKGFQMGEVLIRAAQVSVADEPPKASKEAPPKAVDDDGSAGVDEMGDTAPESGVDGGG